tara:strand:+ start:4044 stop:4271 length:228 start_codon:yes stop_codon:yes gene_type:complete
MSKNQEDSEKMQPLMLPNSLYQQQQKQENERHNKKVHLVMSVLCFLVFAVIAIYIYLLFYNHDFGSPQNRRLRNW